MPEETIFIPTIEPIPMFNSNEIRERRFDVLRRMRDNAASEMQAEMDKDIFECLIITNPPILDRWDFICN